MALHHTLYLGIDSAVGNNLGIALCHRRENQHASTLPGKVNYPSYRPTLK